MYVDDAQGTYYPSYTSDPIAGWIPWLGFDPYMGMLARPQPGIQIKGLIDPYLRNNLAVKGCPSRPEVTTLYTLNGARYSPFFGSPTFWPVKESLVPDKAKIIGGWEHWVDSESCSTLPQLVQMRELGMITEEDPRWDAHFKFIHFGGCNMFFIDGHVKQMFPGQIRSEMLNIK
jgi:prepilin-type processing-associated H-X9-DG protein